MSKSVVVLTIEKWFETNGYEVTHRRMFDDLRFKLEKITRQPVRIEKDLNDPNRANIYIGNTINLKVHL